MSMLIDSYRFGAAPPSGITDPTDIAGLSLWLDAADTATITASGSNATAWTDKSANGYVLTGSGSPQTGTRTVNSLNAIDFIPTDYFVDEFDAPINNASDGSWTVFAVCVPDVVTGVQSIVDGDFLITNRVAQYIRLNAAVPQTIGFLSTGTTPFTDSGASVSAATPVLLRSVHTGTRIEMFVDGASGGDTAATSQRYTSTVPLSVGAQKAGQQPFNGVICEVVAYSLDLSSGDIADVETYLADKWGTP